MSGNYYPAPPPRSPWSSPLVIGAIVAGVLILALAILLGLLLIPSDDSTSDADASTTTSAPVSTNTVTAAPPTITATTTTTTATISTPVSPLPTVPGTDQYGFISGPRCNSTTDPVVMVGQTDLSKVIVCQVGNQTGQYYYKGLANGLGVEIGGPTRSGNQFVALNLDTTYEMTPSSLTIATNGVVVSLEPMLYYWTN